MEVNARDIIHFLISSWHNCLNLRTQRPCCTDSHNPRQQLLPPRTNRSIPEACCGSEIGNSEPNWSGTLLAAPCSDWDS